ncbi:MAG: carbohydrate-binding family 9-like protein [Lentisphaeria bacterium]|nr:carbohydrate-binding family 9-like protein [Lentisphaeria bacterium]
MEYMIARGSAGTGPTLDWNDPGWGNARSETITHFHAKSSSHHPQVEFKTCWNDDGIRVLFRVRDQYVKSVAVKDMDCVCRDSCVEFFVWPGKANGYFNFEFSCGGVLLSQFIRDWTRAPGGFVDFDALTPPELAMVKRVSTMPLRTEEEITTPLDWRLGFFVPFALICGRPGIPVPVSGECWKGNFFKCADDTSHPHWGMWRPVEPLNFHAPQFFDTIRFE